MHATSRLSVGVCHLTNGICVHQFVLLDDFVGFLASGTISALGVSASTRSLTRMNQGKAQLKDRELSSLGKEADYVGFDSEDWRIDSNW